MDKRALLAVAVAAMVALNGFAGGVAAASSTDVSRATLADESSAVTETLTYTFTPDPGEDSATVKSSMSNGGVEFTFDGWTDLDAGDSGETTTWNVSDGNEYRVTYEVRIPTDTTTGSYAAYSADGGSAREYLETNVVEPRFGNIYRQNVDLAFDSSDSGSATKDVEIPNTGSGLMKPTEITFSGVPSGFGVEYSGLSNEIAGGGSDTVELQISADSTVEEGTYEFQATVTDNLGNTETFPVSVSVTKPAILGVGGGTEIDVGDVLVGSEKTTTFTVTEEGGHVGIDGVNSQVFESDQYGSIGFGDLYYLETAAGGSDTAEVTVTAQENAPQHSQLDWTVRLQPDNGDGVGKRVTFTGRAIYPAKLGSPSVSNTSMVFDRPRSEVSSHTKTVSVSIPNTGDKTMNVWDVTAETDSTDVTANVVDSPDTVEGTSSGTARVEIQADADAREGAYTMDISVDTETAGQKEISEDVTISHGIELSVGKNSMSYGDVIVTKNLTKSTDVAEALEYEDVSGLSVTKVSGPDEWLTVVERPPETLIAGESAPFVVALQFDTSAELYREYTWEYRVTGDNVDNQTVTVTGTAKPYSFDQIRDPLNEYTGSNDWQSRTSSGMVEALDTLEGKLRNDGDVSKTDLSTSIAAGRSTLLFIESVESARETMEEDGNEVAQSEVVRAAASYNLLDSYVSELDDPELRSSAEKSRTVAEETVNVLVETQTDYYRAQLESENVSLIERAHIKRQLAQLASLQSDEERAARLREESAAAFDAYTETVQEGNEQRQEARELHEEMDDSMLTVVVGQPLLLNPAKWDAFDRKSAAVLAAYDEAATSFEEAGATEETSRVRDERQQVATSLQIARYSLYGSTAAYSLGFLGVLVSLGRNTYAYVRDARAAVSGDFLLSS